MSGQLDAPEAPPKIEQPDVPPEGETKSGFRLPSAYTILFALIVLAAIATWIIPAGTYDLNAAGEPIPGTYHGVASHPARILTDSLTAPINGLYGIESATGNINYYNSGSLFGAIDVALFILVIGGFLGVTMKTGAIQAGIDSLVQRMAGRERLMIPALMSVFALGGTTYGMAEESLAFYVVIISVLIAAGYDALTGAVVILLGCGIGTMGSTVNPFATGIASGFAGVTISDGLVSRLVILICGLGIGVFFVMRYADRVKKDPSKSVVYDLKAENEARFRSDTEGGSATMTGRQKVVLAVFGLAFLLMMYGVIPWEDRHSDPDVVVVPGDDGLVPPVRDHHRDHRTDGRGCLHGHVRRRRPRPPRRRAHHRHRARNYRDHEQRPDHGHRPPLV
jgi:uncharacterized ion transporter superfamily protein YfcC